MGGRRENSRARAREKAVATVHVALGSEHGLRRVIGVRGPLNFALSPQPPVQELGQRFSLLPPPPTHTVSSKLFLALWVLDILEIKPRTVHVR